MNIFTNKALNNRLIIFVIHFFNNFQHLEKCISLYIINIIIRATVWPKNQNKCSYKIGSPPPATSKNEVLKFLSNNNIVIPADNTGNDNNNKNAVMKIDHTNNGNLCIVIPFVLIFNVVTMKLIAPNNDEIDVKCNAKIAKSTLGPECAWIDDNGG